MRRLALVLGVAAVLALLGSRSVAGATSAPATCPWLNPQLPVSARVSMLLARMTLADKLDLMNGQNLEPRGGIEGQTDAIPALCVPQVDESDGSAGVGHGVSGATQLPAPVNDAATWDPVQARRYGGVIGAEAWGKGNGVVYGPTINIDRDPRWGRNFESLSEDPLLTGTLAAALVRGIQSQGPIAQVKHYAVYDMETNRNTRLDDDLVSERTLHEIYLPAFYDAVVDGGARSVMCSYSSPDGTFACENPALLSILEQRWGFRGFVGSDYGAVHDPVAAADAGTDQDQDGPGFGAPLALAVADGQVSTATVNGAVGRILWSMFSAGLFDRPAPGTEATVVSTPAHVAFAQENSEEGTVLLKNAGGLLPLSRRSGSIAVIGSDGTADPETAGGGSTYVNPTGGVVTPLAGITALASRRGVGVLSDPGTVPAAAAAVARQARVAIVFAQQYEREGADLSSLALPGDQDALIDAVAQANPRTIVVLNTGGPVTMPWLSHVRGVFEAWYPGQQDGAAIASLLFGTTDPSGHLPETFPASMSQIPTRSPRRFPGVDGAVSYDDGLDVGYRYYDTAHVRPLFAFGDGLSYTSFRFSGLTLSQRVVRNVVSGPSSGQAAVQLVARVWVRNVGHRAGADVAQLYLRDPPSAHEPVRQLEGYQRVWLQPGHSARLSFALDGHALSYWSPRANGWVVPNGRFDVLVGDSSALADLTQQRSFAVQGTVGARTLSLGVGSLAATQRSDGPASVTVTTRFVDGGDESLQNASASLQAPPGWRVTASHRLPARIDAGRAARAAWTVRVPAGVRDAVAMLHAGVRGSTAGRPAATVAQASQSVSLAEPVAVRTAPVGPVLNPGGADPVGVTVLNELLGSVRVTLVAQPPPGVTVTPSAQTVTLDGRGVARPSFTVTATAAGVGPQTIPVRVLATSGRTLLPESPVGLSVNVAYPSLAAAFDNVGAVAAASVNSASFDLQGHSYPAAALAAAGLAPGATFTHDGIGYTWPAIAAGAADDVTAAGEAVAVSGAGTTLGLIGACSADAASGPVTVVYADGTTSTSRVSFANWAANRAAPGSDIVATTPDWIGPVASGVRPVSLYAASVPLVPGRPVADVVLPTAAQEAPTQPGPMHVFAIGIGGS